MTSSRTLSRTLSVAAIAISMTSVSLLSLTAHDQNAQAAQRPTLTQQSPAHGAADASKDDHINYAVVVSIDGLNPDAISRLGAKRLPTLHRLIANGASTMDGRTAVESTSTLPNHASMITSRPVTRPNQGHGVVFNDDDAKTTVHRAAGEYVHSMFDVAHNRGRSTALFTSKDKFALYNRSWDGRHGTEDRTGPDNGRDKIGTFVYRENEDEMTRLAAARFRSNPAKLTMVHFSRTDKIGHDKGFLTPAYFAELEKIDRRLGTLVHAANDSRQMRGHVAFIVTADHGGDAQGHRFIRDPQHFTVPFIVWGEGIARGAGLYAINQHLERPGNKQVGYGAKRQPVRNGMAGNLALDLLDLPAIPNSQFNAGQRLNTFPR